MPKLHELLKTAVAKRGSDLHINSGEPIRLRIDGDLVPIAEEVLSAKDVQAIFFEVLSNEEQKRLVDHKNLDKSYSVPEVGNFRLNIFYTRKGMAAAIRTIPTRIPSIEGLGLPAVIPKLLESPKGLILVTGPTGSGKSTTLAAMIDYIKKKEPLHILTVEDPVEFVHDSGKSLVNQREIGASCQTFADALKYALREDPDVILIGEMRDLETISLALTAAETGHLVFGTLHTRGAGASVDRIIDSFPANQQPMVRTMLAESLVAVISQNLLKRADGSGRVGAYEIMVVNHAISNLIREGKTFQITSIMQTGRKDGMILMDQYMKDLVAEGIVDAAEVSAHLDEGAMSMMGGASPKRSHAPLNMASTTAGSVPLASQKPAGTSATPMAPPKPAAPPAAPVPPPAPAAAKPNPVPPPPPPGPKLQAPPPLKSPPLPPGLQPLDDGDLTGSDKKKTG